MGISTSIDELLSKLHVTIDDVTAELLGDGDLGLDQLPRVDDAGIVWNEALAIGMGGFLSTGFFKLPNKLRLH